MKFFLVLGLGKPAFLLVRGMFDLMNAENHVILLLLCVCYKNKRPFKVRSNKPLWRSIRLGLGDALIQAETHIVFGLGDRSNGKGNDDINRRKAFPLVQIT